MLASKVRLSKTAAAGTVVTLLKPGRGGPAGSLQVAPGVSLIAKAGGAALYLEIKKDPEAARSTCFRRAGGGLRRALEGLGLSSASVGTPAWVKDADVAALVEGLCLGGYAFTEYLPKARLPKVVTITLVGAITAGRRAAHKEGLCVAQEVALARDLVNRPAIDLHPKSLVAEARAAAKRTKGLKVKVYQGKGFETQFPAIHTVGKASEYPPCMIRIDYDPGKKACGHYAVVGKGITYDSGGYHIKPLASMLLMKKDMGASATVLAAIEAVARRKLNVRVTALLAVAENMISSNGFKPGDIIPSRSGKTIQIRSTDAEGRLVMCDALTYATELKPDAILDMGTLTGVASRFLGDAMAPTFGTDAKLIKQLEAAGQATHERLLPIPLLQEFRDATVGTISDLNNWGSVGGHGAGTAVCAGYLSHFVGDYPWVHIDMSNTSWGEADVEDRAKGGSGFGVRLLTRFFSEVSAGGRP